MRLMICSVVKRLFFIPVLSVDGLCSFTWYGSVGQVTRRVEDQAVLAYLAFKAGHVAESKASYDKLVRNHTGSDQAVWENYAIKTLTIYKFQADATRTDRTTPTAHSSLTSKDRQVSFPRSEALCEK